MKKYIIILIASLMATSSKAQTIKPQQERAFYQKAYQVMMDYAQSAAIADETEEYNFRRLFSSDNINLCNDLMSLSRETTLPINEYISILQSAKRVRVSIRNIRKASPIIEDEENVWSMYIAFEKGISYSKCGTLFNSVEFFGEYYRLKARVSMNKSTGLCQISALVADEDYQSLEFPEDFTILERTHEDENLRNYKRDDKLTINGRDVSGMWNLYGQVMLHPGDKIKYNNAIVDQEVVAEDRCGGRKIHAKYNDKSFRVRANMGYSLSGFNGLDNGSSNLQSKDNEMSFGLDVGYVLPSTSKFYVGFFAGVGLSMNGLTLTKATDSSQSMDIECPKGSRADEDDDAYIRHYKVGGKGIEQEFSTTEIAIPVYADLEYQFIPMLSAYVNLGARLQTTSDKWQATIGEYETTGTYPAYNNLIIDGSVNLNGFGQHAGGSIDIDYGGMKSNLSICALLGTGLRTNIGKSFAIDAGIQYLIGGKVWEITDNKKDIFSYKLPDGDTTAMDADAKAKGDRVNLLRETDGIKRSALRVSVGLIFKF